MSSISKDSKVQDLQIEQKSLQLKADLVAQTSESASLVSISGAVGTTTVSIDVKEPVTSCEKVQIINRSSGQSEPLSAAPSVSGNSISVTLDASGLDDVCICVDYRN
jgi:hypothetical protein